MKTRIEKNNTLCSQQLLKDRYNFGVMDKGNWENWLTQWHQRQYLNAFELQRHHISELMNRPEREFDSNMLSLNLPSKSRTDTFISRSKGGRVLDTHMNIAR
jgi:hypothetical protein